MIILFVCVGTVSNFSNFIVWDHAYGMWIHMFLFLRLISVYYMACRSFFVHASVPYFVLIVDFDFMTI